MWVRIISKFRSGQLNMSNTVDSSDIASLWFSLLEESRIKLNLTQKEVADKLGVGTKTYRAIGSGSAKMATFIDAAAELGVLAQVQQSLQEQICEVNNNENSESVSRAQSLVRSQSGDDSSTSETSVDWHRAKIIAELKIKAGVSLRQLSVNNNLSVNTVGQALERSYPHMEKIIAEAIGVEPKTILPSRYTEDGKSSRKRLRKSKA